MVVVVLSMCPLLKSSMASRHASSNPGLGRSPLSSAFLATDWPEAVPEDSPVILGPVSLDIELGSSSTI